MAVTIETKDTIMGSEMEWPIIVRLNGKPYPNFFSEENTVEFFRKCIGQPLIHPGLIFPRSNNVFLTNAARIYQDTGWHIEYGTPEASGPWRLVMDEKAGERIMELAMQKANELWAGEGFHFSAFKSNLSFSVDSGTRALETFGSHESYRLRKNSKLVDLSGGGRIIFDGEFVSTLDPFLASRILFCGNGWEWPEFDEKERKNKFHFWLSQRALKMAASASGATTSGRGILNTRDEPLAKDGSRRLHLIVGDALLFQAALFLKYATTAMILDAIQDGYFESPPLGTLNNEEIMSICRFFADGDNLHVQIMINGKGYTIIDVQEIYLKALKKFYEAERDMGWQERRAFELWEKIVILAKNKNSYLFLTPYVDWAAKRLLFEQDRERRKYSRPDDLVTRARGDREIKVRAEEHVMEMNLRFHDISPEGLARKLMDAPGSEIVRIVPEEKIKRAIFIPDRRTRAYARFQELQLAVREYRCRGKLIHVMVDAQTWSYTKISFDGHTLFEFFDPDPSDPVPHPGIDPVYASVPPPQS